MLSEAEGIEAGERRSKRQRTETNDELTASASTVVEWERFLPKMVLRVLLVEADDSTRQIVAALLRKCRYKVEAVPDGLKAWETLKEKPHSIDIILTEVELPSISGFSLLTLVMEHDVCKNIPVIMTSSHDSISMVLKCMLKGAADFLIKPVRKNELRNLWQHVWRRHSLTGGCIPQNLSVIQQEVEVCTENNTVSNHSSDRAVSSHQDKDSSNKGSDAQGLLQPERKSASHLSNCDIENYKEYTELLKESTEERPSKFLRKVAPSDEADNSITLRLEKDCACAKGTTHRVCMGSDSTWNGNYKSEINCWSDEANEPLSRANDFIGTFEYGRTMCSHHVHSGSINSGSNKVECTPQLELSLSRFCPSSLKNDGAGQRRVLNHSNASAFSWYNNTNKTLQSVFPTQPTNFTSMEDKIRDLMSSQCTENNIGNNGGNDMSRIHSQSGQAEMAFPRPQFEPVIYGPRLRYDDTYVGYGHVLLPSLLHTKSEMLSSASSLKPACQLEQSCPVVNKTINTEMKSLKRGCDHGSDDILIKYNDNGKKNLEGMGETESSSLCDGNTSGGAVMSQREAALTKFRLKRKDRCYQRMVRYEKRKRVADERPRVKGQFVRQLQ